MNIQKRWAKVPPIHDINTLRGIVADFLWRFPRDQRDFVVTHVLAATNLPMAIERAVMSKGANGKHYHHQQKVRREAYQPFVNSLMRADWLLITNFDKLLTTVDAFATPGIGPVTIYDVSVRIGAYLNKNPEYVYIHAHVKAGVKALSLKVTESPLGWPVVHPRDLPAPLQDVTPDEAEDFLCGYAEEIARVVARG